MKVRPSVKKICEKCKIIKRRNNLLMEVQLTNGAYIRY